MAEKAEVLQHPGVPGIEEGAAAARTGSKGLWKRKAPVDFHEVWKRPMLNIAQSPQTAGEAPSMIHETEAQERLIKSSHQAPSPAPAPAAPSFALGEQGLMEHQDRASWSILEMRGRVWASCHVQPYVVYGNMIFLLQLDPNL